MITAIVPTYQRSKYLEETLAALTSQTRPLHQIIIWDDGSTDSTPEIGRAAQNAHPDLVSYYRDVNGGKSRALNRAMEFATGDYIWICDDDDISLPDAGAQLGAVLDEEPVDLVAGPHRRFSRPDAGGDRVEVDAGYWPDLRKGSILRHTLEDIFFFQNGTLVRQSAYKKVGPFDESLARSIDLDMTVRLLARGPAQIIEPVTFLQRKHDGARGPAAARHAAAKSEDVWRNADREIFAKFRDTLPLSLYCAMFDGDDPLLIQRAAIIQRAVVYARRCDWDVALKDFNSASELLPGKPFTALEWDITVRAMAGKHSAPDAFSAKIRLKIKALSDRTPVGRSISCALARGARWRMRAALQAYDPVAAARIARFLLAIAGSKDRPRPDGSLLQERSTLPSEAYLW